MSAPDPRPTWRAGGEPAGTGADGWLRAVHRRPDAERRRLARRANLDRRRLHRAFARLAAVLDPRRGGESELHRSADPLFDACRMVGAADGIALRPAGGPGGSLAARLVELAESNGVRQRRVLLRDDWWRHDNGALLAFGRAATGDEDLGRPMALLPGRGGRYELVDPASGERRRVDAEVAAELHPEAVMFYPPLPARPLRLLDLVRAALGRRTRDLAGLLAVSVALGLLSLLVPLLTHRLVDVAIARSDRLELAHLVGALVVGALAAVLFQVVRGALVIRVRGKLDGSLQAALWDRLLSLPVSFFRRFTVGDLEARAMGIDRIRDLLGGVVTSTVLSAVAASFSLGLLFSYSAPLATVAVGGLAVLAVFVAVVAVLQLRHQRELHDERGRMASFLYALLNGIVKLRVAHAELRAFTAWAERFARLRSLEVSIQRLANLQAAGGASLVVAALLAVFWTAAGRREADFGVGEFLAFHAAFGQLTAAAVSLIAIVPTVLAAVPVYRRMLPILQARPDGGRQGIDPGRLRGGIELRDVSFRYQASGPPVLDGVSIAVRPGELVALVGPSGSGKSTCLRLMLGFEEPSRGQVLVDDTPLGELDLHAVRRQVGAVLQNSRPLVGDVLHNILGARPLGQQEAWRAARLVGLEEEIRAMPMGMLTFVNQRGVTFSGGQRQRLLLARAIVGDPRLLLLDEATSALDNRTQDLVIENLNAMRVTRVVVAHRLSTIRQADRIYVLDRGRVVQCGTYDHLAAQEGLFRRLIERQIADAGHEASRAFDLHTETK